MSLSQTPKKVLTPEEAKHYAQELERFARVEHSHVGSAETEVILRLAVGVRRKLDIYRRR